MVWSIAEIPLYMAIPIPEGLTGIGSVLLRSLISVGVAYVIGRAVFGSFCEVRKGGAGE